MDSYTVCMIDLRSISKKNILGWLLTVIGLVMLIYTYLVAYAYVINPLLIDQTYPIRIIIFIIMGYIGGYLLKQGSEISDISFKRAVFFLILGIGMLIHSFLTANIFAIVGYGASILLLVLIVFLLIMVIIGLVLTGIGLADFLAIYKTKKSSDATSNTVSSSDSLGESGGPKKE
jgi:hypothetical protein